ncbi:unnamed protein product [Discosporangium mesarthrocarpum]
MDRYDLLQKYARVPDDEKSLANVKDAWTQVYVSTDGSDYRGSRKITTGLLSGSLLPMWSALEKTVVACRSEMTRAEQALKVYRVILDDGRKMVGVKVPTSSIPVLRTNLAEVLSVRKLAVEGGDAGVIEAARSLDLSSLRKVKRPPSTMLNFFSRAPSTDTVTTCSNSSDLSSIGSSTTSSCGSAGGSHSGLENKDVATTAWAGLLTPASGGKKRAGSGAPGGGLGRKRGRLVKERNSTAGMAALFRGGGRGHQVGRSEGRVVTSEGGGDSGGGGGRPSHLTPTSSSSAPGVGGDDCVIILDDD